MYIIFIFYLGIRLSEQWAFIYIYIYIYIKFEIDNFHKVLINDVCSDILNTFWHRKKHIVNLSYVKDFNEKNIPTKLVSFK